MVFRIPVFPFVKKYILKKYGTLELKHSHALAMILYGHIALRHSCTKPHFVLEKKIDNGKIIYDNTVKNPDSLNIQSNVANKYSDSIDLIVSDRIYYQKPFRAISHDGVTAFNNTVRDFFLNEFRAYMQIGEAYIKSKTLAEIASDFMVEFDLSHEEIDLQSLLRDYRRYKNDNTENDIRKRKKYNRFVSPVTNRVRA